MSKTILVTGAGFRFQRGRGIRLAKNGDNVIVSIRGIIDGMIDIVPGRAS